MKTTDLGTKMPFTLIQKSLVFDTCAKTLSKLCGDPSVYQPRTAAQSAVIREKVPDPDGVYKERKKKILADLTLSELRRGQNSGEQMTGQGLT